MICERREVAEMSKEKNSLQKRKMSRALQRGVLTVELALILPLFLLGTGTLICLMDVLRIQTEKTSALCEKAMEEGMDAYLEDGARPVIDIEETYTYRLPVSLVPLPALVLTGRGRVHSWIGADNRAETGIAEEMVYMAASGRVYHTDPRCSHVDLSISQVMGTEIKNLRNQQGGRYGPCRSCSKGDEPAKVVYITGNGDRYHNEMSCSRLKRTVRLVPISEVGGQPLCSRCKKR